MGRKKIQNKNVIMSISLLPQQAEFIKNRDTFELSKFVQLHLQKYIDSIFNFVEKEV